MKENKRSSKEEENKEYNKEGSKGNGEFGWFRFEEENVSRNWRNYEVDTLISIQREMEEEFSRFAKKKDLYMYVFYGSIFF